MSQLIKNIIKEIAARFGYVVRDARHAYGVDSLDDIRKLSAAFNKPIQVAFDVGANVGATSKGILRMFPVCNVFAFEPHQETFEQLERNIINNRFQPVHLALSDTGGMQAFYAYDGAGLINSLTNNARFAVRGELKAKQLTVEVKTVDQFCVDNNIKKIDILKVDTEGCDFRVLKGSEKMLSNNSVSFIYFEFNDFMPKAGTDGGSLNEVTEYLSRFGFHFVAIYTDYVKTEGGLFVVANALLFNPGSQP